MEKSNSNNFFDWMGMNYCIFMYVVDDDCSLVLFVGDGKRCFVNLCNGSVIFIIFVWYIW